MQFRLATLGLLALCITSAYAENSERAIAEKLINTINYINENQAETWPGFHLSGKPIMVHFNVDENTCHLYAFNFKPVNPNWMPLYINGQTVYFMANDEYEIRYKSEVFMKIDGQRSYIYNMYDADITESLDAVMVRFTKNRFFAYQHLGNESNFPKTDPYKTPLYTGAYKAEQITLGYLEIEALKGYLQTNDAMVKENRLRDAVAINQYRTNHLDVESQMFEPSRSRHWGLSYYVGWKGINLTSDERYLDALPSACDISTKPNFWDTVSCMEDYRFTFLTTVYGLSLDRKTNTHWKSERNHKSVEERVKHSYQFTEEEAAARVNRIIKNNEYNYKLINETVDNDLGPYMTKLKEAESQYQQESGVEIQVYTDPDTIDLQAGKEHKFAPKMKENSYIPINNNAGIFTESCGLSAGWGNSNQGFLIEHCTGGNVYANYEGERWFKFKLAPEAIVQVDGRKTTLGEYMQDKKHVGFSNLKIKRRGTTIRFKNMHGNLDASNGQTVIVKAAF